MIEPVAVSEPTLRINNCAHLNVVNVRLWTSLPGKEMYIGECADCKSTISVEKP